MYRKIYTDAQLRAKFVIYRHSQSYGKVGRQGMNGKPDSYSIRQLVDLTGLSEFTLRGWESRYGAFTPRRTSTGRRVYSAADIEKAILLRELTLRDYRIGEIAGFSYSKLRNVLEKKPVESNPAHARYQDEIDSVLKATSLQKWDEVEFNLNDISKGYKARVALRDIFAPLAHELGQMVGKGVVSISQEHIFSSLLKKTLYVLISKADPKKKSKRFVVAAPEGDIHEMGILIAHAMVVYSGFKSLYLGPNSPKKDLCETAHRYGASNILIGSTVSRREGAKEDFLSYFHFLDRNLNRNISVWTGGRNIIAIPIKARRDVLNFPTLVDLCRALED